MAARVLMWTDSVYLVCSRYEVCPGWSPQAGYSALPPGARATAWIGWSLDGRLMAVRVLMWRDSVCLGGKQVWGLSWWESAGRIFGSPAWSADYALERVSLTRRLKAHERPEGKLKYSGTRLTAGLEAKALREGNQACRESIRASYLRAQALIGGSGIQVS